MRIAVYHNLPSGGAKRVLYETVRRLAVRHQIDVYSLRSSNAAFCDVRPFCNRHREFDFQPSTLYPSPLGRLNQWSRRVDLRRLNRLGREIAHEIDARKYDVVWVHPCMWLQAPHVLQHLTTPSSFFVHEPMRWAWEDPVARPYSDAGPRKWMNRLDPLIRLYRESARAADRQNLQAAGALLANSRFTAESAQRIYDRSPEVCRLGVDSDLFRPTPIPKRRELLSVGEIRPEKGFDFLIESVALLPRSQRPPLRLIGNAPRDAELAFLRRLARDRAVELIVETDVDVQTLVQRYNEAALLVYSPIREPFGLVPLEAGACATPAVAVAEGGVRESVVDQQTGLLTSRDPRLFADAVHRLLEAPDRRTELGRSARRHALSDWSWGRAVAQIESALAQTSRAARAA